PSLSLYHSKLADRPGVSFPDDSDTLNLLEELIYHSREGHRIEDGKAIYAQRLGGREHLGKALGEYQRGARIAAALGLELDLAWYLRGLGELGKAHELLAKE